MEFFFDNTLFGEPNALSFEPLLEWTHILMRAYPDQKGFPEQAERSSISFIAISKAKEGELMRLFTLFNQHNNSELFNEKTFYGKFLKDLGSARKSILIESSYIVSDQMDVLTPVFQRVLKKEIQIVIIRSLFSEKEVYGN